MKVGDKVKWKDLVSGRTRYGVLHEKELILEESQELKDMYDTPKFKEVNELMWTVIEDESGKLFILSEKDLEVLKYN